MKRLITFSLVILAIVASGVVHGMWTDRWGAPLDVAAVATRIGEIPDDLGDWQGQPLEQDSRPPKGVAGHLHRRYVNRRNGETVTVAIVGGRPGPISIHTPDACYGANGFEVATRTRYALPHEPGEPAAEFWAANFQKNRASERTQLRIFWAWSCDGTWQATDNPRLTFAREPILYKLYLIRELMSPDQPLSPEDPCVALMQQLGPELQKVLFGSP